MWVDDDVNAQRRGFVWLPCIVRASVLVLFHAKRVTYHGEKDPFIDENNERVITLRASGSFV